MKIREIIQRSKNELRSEGIALASRMTKILADQVVDGPYQEYRRGLLAASAFLGVLSQAVRTGQNEIGMADIDGEVFPIDLKLEVRDL
jgi:hypothetical protein